MPALDETFEEFLKRRESVSLDYVNGNANTLVEISTARDPATFFPPNGDHVSGADNVNRANERGATSFKEGSTGHFQILQFSQSGDLAFWTGFQHAEVMMDGKGDAVPMSLRVTEVFRREDGEWKLVHRHADIASKDKK